MIHKFTTDELISQKPSPEDFFKIKRNPLVFILHNLRSLENVGLFFRLADALLIEKIYLTGFTGYPRLPENDPREERLILHAEKEIAKTAIKLVPFVPWEQSPDILGTLSNLSNLGYLLTGVEQTTTSLDYHRANYKFPLALIFGHERLGVEDQILEKCDFLVHIPMLGLGNSHNVATAGAIISTFVLDKYLTPPLVNPPQNK